MTEPRYAGTKTCGQCRQDLHVICFAAADTPDGLAHRCRGCDQETAAHHGTRRAFTFSDWAVRR